MSYHYLLDAFAALGLLWLVWKIAIIVLIIWFLWLGLRLFRRDPSRFDGRMNRRQSHAALSILNERYAKGEIDKAEYEERKKTLMS